jgi:hypothetical protein
MIFVKFFYVIVQKNNLFLSINKIIVTVMRKNVLAFNLITLLIKGDQKLP